MLDDPLVRCVLHGYIEVSGVHDSGQLMYQLTPRGRAALAVSPPSTCTCGAVLRSLSDDSMDRTLWIELRGVTFGLVSRNGTIVQAAPVARYTEGWTVERTVHYFTSRGAVITEGADHG